MKMTIKRHISGILLSFALILVILSAAVMCMKVYADNEAESYQLWVGNEEVKSNNLVGKGWEYDPEEKILALDGELDIKEGHIVNDHEYGIYYTGSDELIIDLRGGASDSRIGSSTNPMYTGIYSKDENAKVTFSNGGGLSVFGTFHGIEIEGDLTIEYGILNAYGDHMGISGNNVKIENGIVNANGTNSAGLYGKSNVTINDGTVNASLTGASGYGIQAQGGSVDINGGKVTATSGYCGIYARVGSVNINRGAVVASGGERALLDKVTNAVNGVGWDNLEETTNGKPITVGKTGRELTYKKVEFTADLLWVGGVPVTDSCFSGKGWRFDPHSNTLTLSGANITTGYNRDDTLVYGIYYPYRTETLNIVLEKGTVNTISGLSIYNGIVCTDAKLSISGEGTLIVTGIRQGIYSKGLSIKDATVTAVGDTNTLNSEGIYSYRGSIYIKSGTVNATGSKGIRAYENITIESGTINATGSGTETGDEGSGIFAGGDIDIKGGTINTTGSGKTGFGIRSEYGNVIIGNNAILTAAGTTRAIDVNTQYRTVKNANVGLGWTDMRGTKGQTTIDISRTGQDMSLFKRVQFPAYAGEPDDDETAVDSGSGSAGSSKLKSVNTGDENDLRAWIVLFAASLTGTAGLAFARKRRDY